MSEKFQLSKAMDFSPTAVAKSTSSVLKGLLVLVLVAVCGWSIWIALIKPHTKWAEKTNTQNQTFVVQPGGTVKVEAPSTKAKDKRLYWYIFVEPFCQQGSHSDLETGVRGGGGIKIEF